MVCDTERVGYKARLLCKLLHNSKKKFISIGMIITIYDFTLTDFICVKVGQVEFMAHFEEGRR